MDEKGSEIVSFYKTPMAQSYSALFSGEVAGHFESVKAVYEKYTVEEGVIDVERVQKFVEDETGITTNCNVYVINDGDHDKVAEELQNLGVQINLDDEVRGMYDPSTNSVIVFSDKSPSVHLESVVVHETLHSIGYRSQLVELDGKSLRHISKRSGLSFSDAEDYGESFEEGLAEHFAAKYRQKFADVEFFAAFSKHLGHPIVGFGEIGENASLSFNESDTTFDLPTRYLSIGSEGVHTNKSQMFAYIFDLMAGVVYKKTGQSLEQLSLKAKKDPYQIKDLAKTIDLAVGKGTYLKFQKIQYKNGLVEEFAQFVETLKKSAE